jgi:predicted PurR-regulated permease PerM
MVQREAASLPPALDLLWIFLLGYLLGPWGFILATPLLVVVMVLVQQLYVADWLGDRSIIEGDSSGSS